MTKINFTINNNEFTTISGLQGSIKSITLNHKTSILTVSTLHSGYRVHPIDDFWDHLVEKYFC